MFKKLIASFMQSKYHETCDHCFHDGYHGHKHADAYSYIIGRGWVHFSKQPVSQCCHCEGMKFRKEGHYLPQLEGLTNSQ